MQIFEFNIPTAEQAWSQNVKGQDHCGQGRNVKIILAHENCIDDNADWWDEMTLIHAARFVRHNAAAKMRTFQDNWVTVFKAVSSK